MPLYFKIALFRIIIWNNAMYCLCMYLLLRWVTRIKNSICRYFLASDLELMRLCEDLISQNIEEKVRNIPVWWV